jgi:hypothetical protein
MGNHNLPYVSHDINVAIESYHANLKATLRMTKSRLCKRHVDWCIHKLIGDVLSHYWYQRLRKNWGFVPNKKREQFVVKTVIGPKEIPNNYVIFPKEDGGYAIITSLAHEHLNCEVYNPKSKWAYCECLQSQRGNICKHQIKVIMFLRPDIIKGTIAHYYDSLSGTLNGGLSSMFNP